MMGIRDGWDFNIKEHREEARFIFEHDLPALLTGSLGYKGKFVEASTHIGFFMQVYREQVARGGYIIDEQRRDAASRDPLQTKDVTELPGMRTCCFGLAIKPIKVLTNAPWMARRLNRRCNRDGKLAQLEFYRALCKGYQPSSGATSELQRRSAR